MCCEHNRFRRSAAKRSVATRDNLQRVRRRVNHFVEIFLPAAPQICLTFWLPLAQRRERNLMCNLPKNLLYGPNQIFQSRLWFVSYFCVTGVVNAVGSWLTVAMNEAIHIALNDKEQPYYPAFPHLTFRVRRRLPNGIVVWGNTTWGGNGFGNSSEYIAVRDGRVYATLTDTGRSWITGDGKSFPGTGTYRGFVNRLAEHGTNPLPPNWGGER